MKIISRVFCLGHEIFTVEESDGSTSLDFYPEPQKWTHPYSGSKYIIHLVKVSYDHRDETLTITWKATYDTD
jgi:hypothetical protein